MWRVLIGTILFLLSNVLFSQPIVGIEQVTTNEIILKGDISGKYPVTIYLKKYVTSPDHLNVYSVKGWYYYDKIQEKIPLVGIFDGDLTLYVFEQQEKSDSILNFESENLTFYEYVNHFREMSGFQEKFVIHPSGDTVASYWQSEKKKLNFLYYKKTIEPCQTFEFLKIDDRKNTYWQNLYTLFDGVSNFQLEATYSSYDSMNLLFSYEYPSRGYIQGMCGAGIEMGYCFLKLNNQYEVVEAKDILIESCLLNIGYEEVEHEQNGKQVLKISIGEEDKIQKLILDKRKGTLFS